MLSYRKINKHCTGDIKDLSSWLRWEWQDIFLCRNHMVFYLENKYYSSFFNTKKINRKKHKKDTFHKKQSLQLRKAKYKNSSLLLIVKASIYSKTTALDWNLRKYINVYLSLKKKLQSYYKSIPEHLLGRLLFDINLCIATNILLNPTTSAQRSVRL